MKMDADGKELLDSVERGMEVCQGWQARARPVLALCKGHVPEGPQVEHPAVEQGPGGDSEAGAGGRIALPDTDRTPAAQVRVRPPQRGLTTAPQ